MCQLILTISHDQLGAIKWKTKREQFKAKHESELRQFYLARRKLTDGIHTANLGRYENISSTAIRAAIEAGDMETAGHMLGGPYLIRTDTPHDPTKLLPPGGEYRVQVPGAPQSEERMWIDSSLFAAPARYPRIRILGK